MNDNLKIDKDVAILLSVIDVRYDTKMLLPVDVIVGKCDDGIFETISGQCYYSLENAVFDNTSFAYVDELTDIELMEIYGERCRLSYKEAVHNYLDEYEEVFYIVNSNKDFCGKKDYILRKMKIGDVFKAPSMFGTNNKVSDEMVLCFEKLQSMLKDVNLNARNLNNLKRLTEPFVLKFVDLYNAILEEEKSSKRYVLVDNNPKNMITDMFLNPNNCLSDDEVRDITNMVVSERKKSIISYDASSICKKINEVVLGQSEHVERLVYEVLRLSYVKSHYASKNSGILLTGNTGVGKTKIVSLLGRFLDRPVLIVDSTQLSIPGYVGANIEDFLQMLYEQEKGNMKRIENAIVIFDEIDKKGSSKNSDISGRGVLNTLLKFLDGTTYHLKCGANVRTNKMITIFAGAFFEVYDYNKKQSSSIGFMNDDSSINVEDVSLDEFMKRALFPEESVGRFPVLIHLNSLTKDDLVNILKNSKESDIEIQKEMFRELGFTLNVLDSFYDRVSDIAYKDGTGARSLQKYVYEATVDAFKYVVNNTFSDDNSFNTVTIGGDILDDTRKFILGYEENRLVLGDNSSKTLIKK